MFFFFKTLTEWITRFKFPQNRFGSPIKSNKTSHFHVLKQITSNSAPYLTNKYTWVWWISQLSNNLNISIRLFLLHWRYGAIANPLCFTCVSFFFFFHSYKNRLVILFCFRMFRSFLLLSATTHKYGHFDIFARRSQMIVIEWD